MRSTRYTSRLTRARKYVVVVLLLRLFSRVFLAFAARRARHIIFTDTRLDGWRISQIIYRRQRRCGQYARIYVIYARLGAIEGRQCAISRKIAKPVTYF